MRSAQASSIKDIVEFVPQDKYDLIISISTLEHVGWDEQPQKPGKLLQAIDHLRATCLAPIRPARGEPPDWVQPLLRLFAEQRQESVHDSTFPQADLKTELLGGV